MNTAEGDVFSAEEVRALIMALANGHGQDGFNDGDVQIMYDWAVTARVDAATLALVLDGLLYIRVKAGELTFYDARD